jgi:hypothetical protein
MTIEVACQCGHTLKFPDAGAGRKGRCKACGAAFRIPDPGNIIPDPGNVIAEPDPGSATPDDAFLTNFAPDDQRVPFDVSRIVLDEDKKVVARPVATAAAPQPPRVPADPEPWYYGFLGVYATATMTVGLTVCGMIIIFGLYTAFPTVDGETKFTPYGLVVGAIGAACVVPVLLASAPIFLAVDAARNLRAIRYSHAPGAK